MYAAIYVASTFSLLISLEARPVGGPMNQVNYTISNPSSPSAAVRVFRGEFFEFYGSEISTKYSEVSWHSSKVQLPQDIVHRFDGKVMAITGVETDIVRLLANGSEEVVPCFEQYNHHYSNWMHGKGATLLREPQELMHGHLPTVAMDGNVALPTWDFADSSGSIFPRVQVFSEGNGNEHRGSFKGYPQGMAQLIESPVSFVEGPMIINTNKRLTDDKSPGHVNNKLLPRKSLAPPRAGYSGLVECPCTSRKPKILDNYTSQSSGICAQEIESVAECEEAWKKLKGATRAAKQYHGDDLPHGCSYVNADQLIFNFGGKRAISKACSSSQVCVCRDPTSTSGSIAGVRFADPCAPYPTSDLTKTHNAICDIRDYNGGLRCCSGGSILLDADQEVPNQLDSFHMKYRFYFEEYTSQRNAFRIWWSTEAMNNEYDVPKSGANCLDPTTPKENCEHVIRSVFRGVDLLSLSSGCMMQGDINACGNVTRIKEDGGLFQLVYAGPHCHAPACASMELWNEDTGELLCAVEPIYGKEAMCELSLPPCVWGSAAEGLKPPPILHLDSNLTVVKRANNTNGHWGNMALWQMRATYLFDSKIYV